MRKFLIIIIIAAIAAAAFFSLLIADKNSKSVAGFPDGNTVFEIKNGTVTILNEEIKLK